MAEGRGVEPHPISENLVFKASRRTNPAALPSNILGTKRRDRTAHAQIFSLSLYQLSYLGIGVSNEDRTHTEGITIPNATTTS